MQIICKQGQWPGDIAIQESGSLESVFELAQRADLSITDKLVAGTVLESPGAMDRRVMNYYSLNGIVPATDSGMLTIGGIGYMGVAISFVVS